MRTLEAEEAKMLVSKTQPPILEELKEEDLVVPKPKKVTKRKKTHRKRKSTLKSRKVR